jgi:hypothetical protein
VENPPDRPHILLLDGGALRGIAEILEGLGLDCVERAGGATPADVRAGWDLVIGTPHRMLEFEEALPWGVAIRVAIVDDDSRTLRSALRRADIDFVVRRPVHPEALRLLFRHVFYRGPEKRRERRVSIGAAIRYRVGWRRRAAILAELSVTGCRLIAEEELPPGRQLSLQIPAEVAGGRSLRVLATVQRSHPSGGPEGEPRRVALSFDTLPVRSLHHLEEVVALHREGPAVFSSLPDAEVDPDDRRRHPRHALERRVIALAADSAPVLLGRDLSLGGMRVEAHPGLAPGVTLQLAVHVRPGEPPLVVQGRVARDDGPRGLVLEFEDLTEPARDYLARMVHALPILELSAEGEPSDVFPSEILSQTAARAPEPRDPAPHV